MRIKFLLEKVLLDLNTIPGKHLDWTTDYEESSGGCSQNSSCSIDTRDFDEENFKYKMSL